MRYAIVTASCVLMGSACSPARATALNYSGFDQVASPSTATATNALTAEADWLNDAAQVGAVHTVDFESLTAGTTGRSFVIAPGVTMHVVDTLNYLAEFEVRDGPMPGYPLINGFNTTPGGTQHMEYTLAPGSGAQQPALRFEFDQPIAAFSTFVTGGQEEPGIVGDFGTTDINATFTNTITTFGDPGFPYWPSRDQPNVRFGGFIDDTTTYTDIWVFFRFYSHDTPHLPSFSVDDVRWVYAPVPEPGSALCLATLALATFGRARPRRSENM